MTYQGKEFTSTLQAPSKESLDILVRSAKKFAGSHQMENFKVLEKGKDPDGGYRAIVTAHNWNPITWIKEKIRGKKRVAEEGAPGDMTPEEVEASRQKLLASGSPEGGWEEAARLRGEVKESREELGGAKEDAAQFRTASERSWRESSRWRQFGSGRAPGETEKEYGDRMAGASEAGKRSTPSPRGFRELTEEEVGKLPWRERQRYQRRIKEARKAQDYSSFEVWSQNVPETITQYHKTLQKEYYTDKASGQPIPEPRTAEERAQADFHPSQWVFLPVEKKLSAPEQLAVARSLEIEGMEVGVAREKYKDYMRDRSLSGRTAKTVAGGLKAVAGMGQFVMGSATMGVAGVARSTRGSRVGQERAARMHAPGVPIDLYAVRPMLGVGIPPARVHTGSGLEHLRELTLPGVRKTRRQVAQVRREVEQER